MTLEHPSETAIYMQQRPDAQQHDERDALEAYQQPPSSSACRRARHFGNNVYGVEDSPKNGLRPSFHTINHIIYHTASTTRNGAGRGAGPPPACVDRR